jgi:undecaprenyl-diphosphatase
MDALLTILGEADHRLLKALVVRRRPPLDRVMRTLTHLGDPGPAIGLSLGLALGWIPGYRSSGLLVLFTLVLSHGFVQLLKRTVTRPRPCLPAGFDFLIKLPECFSFPSGHAAAGLSIALPLALAAPGPVATVILLVGLGVGGSRCYLGVHYPGDVLAGWGLTMLALLFGMLIGLPLP